MGAQPKVDVDLEELLDRDVPCQGIAAAAFRRTCDKPATLRWTDPHGCPAGTQEDARQLKCADCWMVLYQHLANLLARRGFLTHVDCAGRRFTSVLEFTDYRPF